MYNFTITDSDYFKFVRCSLTTKCRTADIFVTVNVQKISYGICKYVNVLVAYETSHA
jgi:hypothetical protein